MSGMELRSNDATSIDSSFVKPGIVKCASVQVQMQMERRVRVGLMRMRMR